MAGVQLRLQMLGHHRVRIEAGTGTCEHQPELFVPRYVNGYLVIGAVAQHEIGVRIRLDGGHVTNMGAAGVRRLARRVIVVTYKLAAQPIQIHNARPVTQHCVHRVRNVHRRVHVVRKANSAPFTELSSAVAVQWCIEKDQLKGPRLGVQVLVDLRSDGGGQKASVERAPCQG